MKKITLLSILVCFMLNGAANAAPLFGPNDRIAISSDGNLHDPDDIGATAASLALLAAAGEKSKLVYYGHSDHIWNEPSAVHTNSAGETGEERMNLVVAQSKSTYGYGNVFFDVYDEVREPGKSFTNNDAVTALKNAINASTAGSKLWLIGAGPMQAISNALDLANQSKIQHVVFVSHSNWNNGHAGSQHSGVTWVELKQKILNNGGTIHCGATGANQGSPDPQVNKPKDQNQATLLNQGFASNSAGPDKWQPWIWMNNHPDPKIKLIYDWMIRSAKADISDAGMTYYILTGDESGNPGKFRTFIETGFSTPASALPQVGDVIALKGNNGKYVAGFSPMVCDRLTVLNSTKFTVVDGQNGLIGLRRGNGNHISSENGTQPMNCNRQGLGSWEKFTLEGGAQLSLKGNNGKYVSSENGNQPMRCNRNAANAWEIFTWEIVN